MKPSRRILSYVAVDCSHAGGVQSVARGLEEGLERRGHHVRTYWSEPTDTKVEGDSVLRLHVRSGKRLTHWPSLLRCLLVLARMRPHVVHCHFLTARIHYFALLKRFFGFDLVLSAHGSDVMRPWPKDERHLGRLLREADHTTAVSDSLADRLSQVFGIDRDTIVTIPNGVDTRRFSPAAVVTDGSAADIGVVTVGRLERIKGHDVLLEAMAQLKMSGLTPRLSLIGDGEEREPLVRLGEKVGLSDRITFAGSRDASWIARKLARSDIFVLPSRSEGMPVALLEAMACGLPCIATSVGGIPELLRDVGITIPPEDPAALRDAIAILIDDSELRRRLSRSARARALTLSSDRSIDQYERLLASSSPP